MKKMLLPNVLLWTFILVTGVVMLISSFSQSAATFSLPGDAPPFLVAQIILICLILLSGCLLVSGLIEVNGGFPEADWPRVLSVVVAVSAAGMLMKVFGFLAVGPASAILTARLLGYNNWLINCLVAVVGVACLYILLVSAARLPLPLVPGLGY